MALYPGDAVLGMGVDQSGDAQNIPVRTHNTAKASIQRGVTIAGSDGTNDQVVKVDNQGRLDVTGSTVTNDFSGVPGAVAPTHAAFVGGMGEVAAEVLAEGNLGAFSLTPGSELRVIEESTSAVGGAAAPVRTLQAGGKANAAAPLNVGENAIVPLSCNLAGAARVLPVANSGVDIGDVDVTSIIPGTGATNLGKAADAVAGAADTGMAPLAVRDDALGVLIPIEGDYVPLRTDANGALWTHDDALDASLAGSELQVDVVAALPAGTNAIGKLAANTGVDIGDVDVTSVIPGTGATNAGKAVDNVAGATDTGVASLAVRDDALTPLVPIDGDYVPLRTNADGALWAFVEGGNIEAGGNVAHDAADSGKPIKTGGKANAAAPVAVTEGDRVDASFTLEGRARMIDDLTEATGGAPAPANTRQVGAKANAAPPAAVDENDIIPLSASLTGELRTKIDNAQGPHDAAAPSQGILVGAKATASTAAEVTEGDLAVLSSDLRGVQRVATEGRTTDLFASGARGAGVAQVSSTLAQLSRYKIVSAILDVTAAATEVTDTLDVYVDTSYDGGTTWVNIMHFTQVLGNGGAKRFGATASIAGDPGTAIINATADLTTAPDVRHFLGNALRGRYTIVDAGGGVASFTFQLAINLKQ